MSKEQSETTLHNVLAKRKENIASSCVPFSVNGRRGKKKEKGLLFAVNSYRERERGRGREREPAHHSLHACLSPSLSRSLDYHRIPADATGNAVCEWPGLCALSERRVGGDGGGGGRK